MLKVAMYTCLLIFGFSKPQFAGTEKKGVEWQQPESLGLYRFDPNDKPILVDVYTDWCHYCKLMDASTWQDASVSAYVNANFVAVKFNAESRDSLAWNGKRYGYQPRYKVNMLAVELLKGNMVYPSTVIITPAGDIQVLRGALKPGEIELALTYYGSGSYKAMDFVSFQSNFHRSW